MSKERRRRPSWEPATLEEVSRAGVLGRFFNVALDEPAPVPVPVPRDARGWAEYEARRRADQLDLSLAGGSIGVGSGGGSGSGRKKGPGVVGAGGGFVEHEYEERKPSYALPTEEDIRAVLVGSQAGAGAGAGVKAGERGGEREGGSARVGMTRRQLEMALKGDRLAVKLGLRERLDEVIARRELGVEGSDWLVWRDDVTEE